MFDESHKTISSGKLFQLFNQITHCVKKLEQTFNLAYGLNSFIWWPLVFVVAAGVKKVVGLIS